MVVDPSARLTSPRSRKGALVMAARALLATAAAALASGGAASAAAPATTFVISGHGWGHGVGMSQWGARGYAEHGWTFDRILAHYYPRTRLGPAPAGPLRVLLVSGAKRVVLASAGPWTVADASGATRTLDPGRLSLDGSLTIAAGPLEGPLSFSAREGALRVGGRAYRGTIQVSVAGGGRLRVVDRVGLEDYARGVVPAEMPSTWPPEALKAQAVAARSFALAARTPSKPYDVLADARSQIYGGVAAETPAADAAVEATAGRVLLYRGRVADALYFSSSGGETAALGESFPDARPVPYLVPVPDPYDASPYVDWGPVSLGGARMAKELGLSGPVEGLSTAFGPSGRVQTATLELPAGPAALPGAVLSAKLGLRSSWLSVGVLSLDPPPAPVVFGSSVRLAGRVRDVAAPFLEQRAPGGPWGPGPPLAPAPDGAFSVVATPTGTTDFRLGAGSVRGAAVRVPVAPSVQLDPSLAGAVVPAVPESTVDVQVQQGPDWLTVATVPVGPDGSFSAAGLPSGTYRAVYAPGIGLVPGSSDPVEAATP